ncbi:MAG: hypothetical protein ACK4YP_28895, partial [Myxococcota bacterium]
MLLFLLGCVAAWRPDATGRFDLAVPPGWEVTKNRRWFGNDFFVLTDDAARASITIELVRDDASSRRLPLDLLAETRALSMGRSLGIESTRSRLHQIELDGHEAWAVTGTRRWKFAVADYSAVIARAGRHVAQVTLQAPHGQLDRALVGWSIVLETLTFPQDRIPDDA